MLQQRVEGDIIQGHERNRREKLVLGKLASMPDTETCGRIPRKIPKTWSVEVVVGVDVRAFLFLFVFLTVVMLGIEVSVGLLNSSSASWSMFSTGSHVLFSVPQPVHLMK